MTKSKQPIRLFGESEACLPKSNPIGRAVLNQYVNQEHLEQSLMRDTITPSNTDFNGDILSGFAMESRNADRSSLFSKDPLAKSQYLNRVLAMTNDDDLLIKQVTSEVNFVREINKVELDAITLKNKWFANFSAGELLILKQLMLSNPAQLFDTTDLMVHEGWFAQPFKDSLSYLPRYSNGKLQNCNLLVKDDAERYQFYSIFAASDSDAIYLKHWMRGTDPGFYARYADGEYQLVRLNQVNGKLVVKVIVNHSVDIASLFAFYGNIFRWRYMEYERAIAKRVPKRSTVTPAEISTEAKALYQEDNDQVTPLLFTVSNAVPKLGQYKGPLSASTGRKMPPHDRQPHYSYRYNPDGSVRIKFPVKAAEVNGGAKSRVGLQISKLKEIK